MVQGSVQKSAFSRDSREPPDCGKQRRIQPFSRESREIRDSRDSSSEKTSFVVTLFPAPKLPWSHKPSLLNGRLDNCKIGGCKETCQPFANPSPTLCQPCANPSPTFRQPFANLFCQPLSNPLFPWTLGTRLETWINGFSELGSQHQLRVKTLLLNGGWRLA